MTDDLKARLRELRGTYGAGDDAAARIEALESALTQSRAETAAAVATTTIDSINANNVIE